MARKFVLVLLAALAGLALCACPPASADITVIGKYRLVSGDTLTRASYFTTQRSRVTAPNGREYLYDGKQKLVTVIDHDLKAYWRGPITLADSIATKMLYERRKELRPVIEANRERYQAIVDSLQGGLVVENTGVTRTIAGYPVTLWRMTAGPYMSHECWVARSLNVQNYGPELEKVVVATMMDPMGRALVRQLIAMRSSEGLVLGASVKFTTLSQSGGFSWEAIQVLDTRIPNSAWDEPKGYRRINL